jgi:methylamine dehydrogenase accessory protein MauD
MTTPFLISYLILWLLAIGVGFLLLGTLRSLGRLQWRFDELQATRPVRKGREGLPPGKPAPDFTLPDVSGREVSLNEFRGRPVLLVFTQSGCGPCHAIAPELNRLHAAGEHRVLVVNNGEPHESQAWAEEIEARFSIVTQDAWSLSKTYQVFATPYAFLVDEQGVIAAKGLASSPQYLRYLFEAAQQSGSETHDTTDRDSSVERESLSSSTSKEVTHV